MYHLYDAKLGIGDRCQIEFFVGPHTINGRERSTSCTNNCDGRNSDRLETNSGLYHSQFAIPLFMVP